MALASFPLSVVISAVDRLSSPLGRMGGKLDAFGGKAKKVGSALTLGVSAPLLGFGAMAISTATDYESSMLRVGALTSATGDIFAGLQAKARKMGATTQFSAKQSADAMGFLAQAGFNVQSIHEALPPTLDLAAAGIMDLATAADLGSNVLTGYRFQTDQYSRVVDRLAGVQAKANTNVELAALAMRDAGPIAAGLGQEFEGTVAIVGALANAGFQGSKGGRILKNTLAQLLEITPAAAKSLARLKISPEDIRDSEGRLRELVDIVEVLEDRGATAEDAMAIFGRIAGPGVAALLGQGHEAIRTLRKELEGVKAADIAARQMSGARGSALTMASAFQELQLAITDSGLLDWFKAAVIWTTGLIQKMGQANPLLLKIGATIGMVAAAAGPLVLGLGLVAGGIAAISAPVWGVIAAVAALGAGAAALMAYWEPISEWWSRMWARMQLAALKAQDWILGKMRAIVDLLPDWLRATETSAGLGAHTLRQTSPEAIAARQRRMEELRTTIAGGTTNTEVRDARVEVHLTGATEGVQVKRDPLGGDAELDVMLGQAMVTG